MLLYARRVLLLSFVAALVACSGATGGSTTPPALSGSDSATASTFNQTLSAQTALAALDAAPEVSGGRAVIKQLSFHPNAKTPATLINFVSDGPAQGGVPCISCVNGASTGDNIGLTGPSSYVFSNTVWQYSLSYTDISFKGTCRLAWAITSGKKTIDSFAVSLKLSTSGGFVLYAFNRNRPKYSGPATLTGKVTCGKNPSQMLSAPLEFQ